ncbi:MAG: C25 family cysteine peptidase [Desulfosalsimonadaceae bacterium]
MDEKRRGLRTAWQFILFILILLSPSLSLAAAPAGYSEYFIPGDEEDLIIFHNTVNNTTFTATHSVITVTAWAPNTVIYYDHWENGYTFDPQDPEKTVGGVLQYDEKQTLATRGASYTFESATIPAAPRNPANLFYDGRDRIYAIGGTVAVNRVTWPSSAGTVEAIGLEVYPVRPQLTTYIMPLGEDLAGAVANPDFERVFALVQATTDGTVVQFDLNGDGVLGDSICTSRNWPCTASATQVALNAGECFLLDRYSSSPTTGDPTTVAAARLNTGTIIQGNQTLQVHYLFCDRLTNYNSRGVSAFPTGFWADQYYAPVGSDTGYNSPTDIFLYNPHSTPITINYESQGGAGSFDVDPNATASYFTETGVYATQNSATYLQGSDVFWGISSIDSGVSAYDWSYSLIPATMLTDEYFIGWAPGAYADPGYPEYPVLVSNYDDSGLFITAAQDNVRVFVDRNSDGTADETFDLAHLQSRYVYDSTDGDMSRSNIWATGPITMAYGQNPDTAVTGRPAIDTGDAIIPGIDFVDLVLSVDKITDPVMVSTAFGSQATYTLAVRSSKYTVDGVSVVDTLPAGWEYVGPTLITKADQTTSNNAPALSGTGNRTLTWGSGILGNMDKNQEITITFTAQTTQVFTVGDMTRNYVEATGTRTVGSPSVTQTFTASDFAFNTFSDTPSQMTVQKTSSGVDPLSPGDSFIYTVVVTNNGASTLNNVAVYDALPAGVSYVTGSSEVIGEKLVTGTDNVRDNFGSSVYDNNTDGSASWASNWVESDGTQSATAGNVRITGGELRLGSTSNIYRQADLSSLRSTIDTATLTLDYRTRNVDPGEYAYVEVASSASGPWTTALSFQNDQSGSLTYSIPSSLWAATTTVRIRVTGYDSNEYLYIDNADITYTHPTMASGTFPADAPPNFVVSGDSYFLSPGQSLTLTYNVIVDSPLATGIESITNSACVTSSQIFVPVCDDVTNIVSNPGSGSAQVGDLIWLDADGDGIKDVSENGLANVEVTLKDQYGTPVAMTTTDANGRFLFTGIEAGNGYYVMATDGLPAGLVQSAPAGHSDNRTGAFNLSAGQIYLDADLGYEPSPETAVIGDLVWSDADGDGIRDLGEPGLGGVTVRLYTDSNGDGVIDGGEPYVETTSGADGSYLFAGVAASGTEDYIVWVDPDDLAAYDITAPSSGIFSLLNVTPTSLLYADFGFEQKVSGTTFSIKDRVWLDNGEGGGGVAADGLQNGTETGVAGVTVALLDAGSNVIATATTDSNGDFQFTGVPGNKNYTWQITDQAGLLSAYYGTTPSALAGKYQMTGNLTTDLDYTTAPTFTPHFGYNVSRAIGDTVFNDIGGTDGVQDAGEPGISGVTVALYRDTNGNSLLDAGDLLAATLVTDANGKYLFSGLANGNYIVSIASPPSGYTYTTESSDDDPAAGHQQAASIVGGVSVLTKDFGYRAATQRKVSGTVWNDANIDGSKTGESGVANVTIALLNGSGTVIATTITNSSGYYEFAGQPSGSYTVRLTDTNGILTDYSTTYEVTEGFGYGSYNGEEEIDLTSGDKSNIDFGYVNPRVTRAVIGEFGAFNEGGKVVVRWQTVSEEGTVGFYLYRLNEKTGLYKMMNTKLLPGLLHSPAGGWYSYQDNTAKTNTYYTYRLEEVEAGGSRISYGPWTVYAGTLLSGENADIDLETNTAVPGFKQAAQPLSDKIKERLEVRMAARLDALAERRALRGIQAKISITEEGLYFVDSKDIAEVLNKGNDEIAALIASNKIRLRNKGRSVAVLAASDYSGLYFYGEKLETRYTDENVYWLDVQTAVKMGSVNRAPKTPAGDGQYFREWVRAEENLYPLTNQFFDPKDDFWMWDYVFPEYGPNQMSLPISTPGFVNEDTATLTVALQGASEAFSGDDHHAVISVNGLVVGDVRLDGLNASSVSFQVNTDILQNGENNVEISGIKESGVPYDIFYINYITIEYPRYYTAVDNYLTADGNGYGTLNIDGFTDPDIRVFDITDPLRPKLLSRIDIQPVPTSPSEYQASFRTGVQSSGRFLAVGPDAVKSCVLVADLPSLLSNRANLGDYLIITSGDMVDVAQTLADYRASQGYNDMVVDVEDIYDEFAYGIRDAEAIRAFLKLAYSKWRIPPKYVLLAGEGSFDYKDDSGFGDSIIPPLLTATPEGLFVTDNLYADVSGDDGIPEFSIGRVPVVNAEEFSNYTSKVIGYESAGGEWRSQALLAADIPDAGGNFPASSEEVAGFFPDEFAIDRIYLDAIPLATARTDFLANINEGRAFVNFIGHGGLTLIGNNNLFSIDKIAQLQNDDRLPVMTAMTCLAGNYGYPGLDSISEAMVLKENGGAVAMWSPSGFAFNHYSVKLCNGFYGAVFSNSEAKTMGDAIRRSQKGYAASGEHLYYLNLYNLMGDPALVIK